MASIFSKFFQGKESERASGPISREREIQIATCIIMIEMAMSDNEFSEDERQLIVNTLQDKFRISAQDTNEIMRIASEYLGNSIDTWSYTHILDRNLSEPEKMQIIESIWRIIYSDGKLSGHEDSLVHKLFYLLGLRHDQLIDAKLRVLREIESGQSE